MTRAANLAAPPVNDTAHKARVWAQIAIPVLFAAIVLPLIGQIYLAIFEPSPDSPHSAGVNVAVHLVQAAPALLLAWTLFGVTKVLAEYERGRFLSLEASVAMKRVGLGGLLALLLNMLVAPVVVAALRGEAIFDALNPNVFDLCVLLFAASTLTIGGVLEDAAKALKAENDQIV